MPNVSRVSSAFTTSWGIFVLFTLHPPPVNFICHRLRSLCFAQSSCSFPRSALVASAWNKASLAHCHRFQLIYQLGSTGFSTDSFETLLLSSSHPETWAVSPTFCFLSFDQFCVPFIWWQCRFLNIQEWSITFFITHPYRGLAIEHNIPIFCWGRLIYGFIWSFRSMTLGLLLWRWDCAKRPPRFPPSQ